MKQIYILFLFFSLGIHAQIDEFSFVRDSVSSEILHESRQFSVFLPASYYASDQTYPVLYIMDGDYNFHYVSGILELQASISENIPEMILIGISGKGSETYKRNCKPQIAGIADSGNAEEFANFIAKELMPYVNTQYKTADYNILAGHSLGGLFVMNTVLDKPHFFNNYIAISPALWWENNAINAKAEKTVANNPNYITDVYMSLANERGMGIDSFLGEVTNNILKNKVVIFGIAILSLLGAFLWVLVTRKKRLPLLLVFLGVGISVYLFFFFIPTNSNFKFKQFSNENHNSVGAPTYKWALNSIFKTWKVSDDYFSSEQELVAHYDEVLKHFGQTFSLQNGVLANTVYKLQENPTELEKIQTKLKSLYPNSVAYFNVQWASRLLALDSKTEAINVLNETITDYPENFYAYDALAKIELENTNKSIADSLSNKALQLSKSENARQWQINEFLETKAKINQ
ncbi:alpha/beta hydrolase [Bizionia myxarmorum]|nr:alpha/beta hydrolase-fold protein [Bizionia myxarmorum]